MRTLFDDTTIGRTGLLPMKNRFIRAAIADRTEDGFIGESIVETYATLAGGGVAAIVSGYTLVDAEERLLPVVRIYDDEYAPGHRKLTDAVHANGGRVLLQIVYIGSHLPTWSMTGGPVAKAPSSVENTVTGTAAREMRPDEIEALQRKFAEAAARGKTAGYDGVEIHAAHGFLLSQFLSPYYNRRDDIYGGSARNRCRMTIGTYEAVRSVVGPNYPVWAKINCTDGMEGGTTIDDCCHLCRELAALGIDAIEVSGNWASFAARPVVYFKEAAVRIADEVDTDVILTGGNRDFQEMTEILNTSKVSYFGMARPFMREPNLVEGYREKHDNP